MMRALLLFRALRTSAAFAFLFAFAPVGSLAQSGDDPEAAAPTRAYHPRPVYRTPLEVWISGEGWDEDYLSSHVCINGFRWMTRNLEHGNASAADNSVPVRC